MDSAFLREDLELCLEVSKAKDAELERNVWEV